MIRWAGYVARTEKRNTYRILMGKPKEKRPQGRQKPRWVGVKIDLRNFGWGDLD
jgi:hypothetical protein